jgi:hypothetical protein
MKERREEPSMKAFDWRRFAALTAGLSLLVVLITGLELLSAPAGRFGHGAGWTIWGLSKGQLLRAHVLMALLLAVASLWHVYFNLGSIRRYIVSRSQETAACSLEFFASLLLVAILFFCA